MLPPALSLPFFGLAELSLKNTLSAGFYHQIGDKYHR